jgi:hypothetical protein
VNFFLNVQEWQEIHSTPHMKPGFYGYRGAMYGAWGCYPNDVETVAHEEGILSVDLVDAEKKALVWQEVA